MGIYVLGSVALLNLIWIISFVFSKSSRAQSFFGVYLAYLFCVFGWVISNLYFQSSFLLDGGEGRALSCALFSNIMGASAGFFVFALSYFLTNNGFLSFRAKVFVSVGILLAFLLNLFPGLTVDSVSIYGYQDFSLNQSQLAPVFFLLILLPLLASFWNIFRVLNSDSSIQKIKAFYICMVLIAYLFAVVYSAVYPLFFNDYQLVWIPPAFGIIDVIVFGYVLVRDRFLSLNLSLIRLLSHLTNTALLSVPLVWLYEMYSVQMIGGVLGAHLAVFWLVFALWTYRQTFPWLEMTWNLVFFRKKTNVLNEISQSVNDFSQSVDRGFTHLAHTLAVRDMQFVSVNDQSRQEFQPMYEYFQAHPKEELVREELDYRITHFVPDVSERRQKSTLEILRENMDLNDLTVVIPVFDKDQNLLGVSVVADDDKERLFSVQEIDATRNVLAEASQFLQKNNVSEIVLDSKSAALSGDEQKSIQENFMRGLLHEIRTPLTMAEGLRDLIDWKKLDKEDQKFLAYSQDSLLKLGQKMERLSQAFSWSRGDMPIHKTFGSVKELCRSLGESFPGRIVDDSLHFSYPEPYENTLFSFDFHRVKEALEEVVGNAFFFNEQEQPDVSLCFDFDEDQEFVRVLVVDNGMGILNADQKKIFEVMYTAAYSRNESESGVGAGLAIARGIARAHGGDLLLEKSDRGEGSVFVLSFPLELVYDDDWDDE